jgi:hypothetical protein
LSFKSAIGDAEVARPTLNNLKFGLSAFIIISAAFNIGDELPLKGISMFDCPEQTQTSPIRMSFNVNFSPSLKVIVKGPPAIGVAKFDFHLPSAFAFMVYTFLSHDVVMVTKEFALLSPKIGNCFFVVTPYDPQRYLEGLLSPHKVMLPAIKRRVILQKLVMIFE